MVKLGSKLIYDKYDLQEAKASIVHDVLHDLYAVRDGGEDITAVIEKWEGK